MENALAVVIEANVWDKALGAAILAFLITIVSIIIRLIKRASLGSEFKDLEKVLDSFGSTNNIIFNITKGEESISTSFTPIQLRKFIRLKHTNGKEWKNNEYGLYKKVIDDSSNTNEFSIDCIDASYNGLHMKSPIGWYLGKTDSDEKIKGMPLPIITSSDGEGNIITAKVLKSYLNIEESVERFIWDVKAQRSKFICGASKSNVINGCSTCSIGYAYKYADYILYGLVIGYQLKSDLVLLLQLTYKDDWSVLCSKSITEIIDSAKYDNTEVHP